MNIFFDLFYQNCRYGFSEHFRPFEFRRHRIGSQVFLTHFYVYDDINEQRLAASVAGVMQVKIMPKVKNILIVFSFFV